MFSDAKLVFHSTEGCTFISVNGLPTVMGPHNLALNSINTYSPTQTFLCPMQMCKKLKAKSFASDAFLLSFMYHSKSMYCRPTSLLVKSSDQESEMLVNSYHKFNDI